MKKRGSKELHIRIWVSGLFATTIVLVMWSIVVEGTNFFTYVLQGFIFYGTWVILQYLIYRPIYYRLIDKQDKDNQNKQ
ncbi:hypothetical protein [Liberiplasma polymorphum]|uniref:hypothetical protein n=1 Tax=Liberiplasma polymorphum TaxID=3374570 RepID=UPI0037747B22